MPSPNSKRRLKTKRRRSYLLGLVKNWLGDVEQLLKETEQWRVEVASFTLTLAERQLLKVKQAVAKYGPIIRVIGG